MTEEIEEKEVIIPTPGFVKDLENLKRGHHDLRKFKSPDELRNLIVTFAKNCYDDGQPITLSGMALHLGVDTSTLRHYANIDNFRSVMELAKQICEAYAENKLFTSSSPSGAIFALKQYGWEDKQVHEHKMQDIPESQLDQRIKELERMQEQDLLEESLERRSKNDEKVAE